jgi:hypothetical protein
MFEGSGIAEEGNCVVLTDCLLKIGAFISYFGNSSSSFITLLTG